MSIRVTVFSNRADLTEWDVRQVKESIKDIVWAYDLDCVVVINHRGKNPHSAEK